MLIADRLIEGLQRFARAKSPEKRFEDLFGIGPKRIGARKKVQKAVYEHTENRSLIAEKLEPGNPVRNMALDDLQEGANLAKEFGYRITRPRNNKMLFHPEEKIKPGRG